MTQHPLPSQDELRGNADPLLLILAERILDFRAHHLHENSDFFEAITNGQKPLAVVSQCVDGRQPVHTITGMPLGKLIAQSTIAGFLRDYPDSPSSWASILFGVKSLGAPIIIKLGHTGCGGAAKLVEMYMNGMGGAANLDPTLDWLQSALPLAEAVMKKTPGMSAVDAARALEEEMVRDGVKKLEGFVDLMLAKGHLAPEQKPVVVGLLFEMRTAKLYHMLDGGEFKLLSQTKANLLHQ